MNRVKQIAIIIFSLYLARNAFAQDIKQVLKSKNWQLQVYEYQISDKEIPVICGLTTILTKAGQRGVTINARLHPTDLNTDYLIDLMKDYKIIVETNEFHPADMCVSTGGKQITLSQDAGRITDLSKNNFPLNLTISFLIPESGGIAFFIENSEPLWIKE